MTDRFVTQDEAETVLSDKMRGKRMTRFPRGQLIMSAHFREPVPFDAPGELNVRWDLRSNLCNEEAEDFNGIGVHVDELRNWCAEAYGNAPDEIRLWCDVL